MTDLGYRKTIPASVLYCAHALAIHEKRFTFRVVRARKAEKSAQTTIKHCWFPGIHSDIGGTSKKEGLGATALNWMFEQGMTAKIRQWDKDVITEANVRANCEEEPSKNLISLPAWFLKSKRTRIIEKDDLKGC